MENSTTTPTLYKSLGAQVLQYSNFKDADGNPAGGKVTGAGLAIEWQNGARGRDADGNLAPANGAFVEDTIFAAIQRLQYFQEDARFRCRENAVALTHLEDAMHWLNHRRQDREARGVHGAHKA